MNKWEKTHWIVILIYEGFVCLSVLIYVKDPPSSSGITAFTAALGPTIGTIILVGITLMHMAGKRIRPACGLWAIALLVVVSLVCLIRAVPLFTV